MGEVWDHYKELITDPAHSLVEFTFVLIDVLIIQWVVSKVKRHFHRDLTARDINHGHGGRHRHEDQADSDSAN